MSYDCFGEYPDNECDKRTCQEFCQDVESCKEGTESGSEEP